VEKKQAWVGGVGCGYECERAINRYHGHTPLRAFLPAAPSLPSSAIDDVLTHEGHSDCWQQCQKEELSDHCEGWRRSGNLSGCKRVAKG
jgi:hypothetical protein